MRATITTWRSALSSTLPNPLQSGNFLPVCLNKPCVNMSLCCQGGVTAIHQVTQESENPGKWNTGISELVSMEGLERGGLGERRGGATEEL